MWFLIKGSFYAALTLVVLSFFAPRPDPAITEQHPLKLDDAFAAASEAYGYVSALCVEKPQVCEEGRQVFQALGLRAREGARVAYELLDAQFSEPGSTADPLTAPAPADTAPSSSSSSSGGVLTKQGKVEIISPSAEALAGAAADESIFTGSLSAPDGEKQLPRPYTPPKL